MKSMITRYRCHRKIQQILIIPVFLLVGACTAIGPPTIARDCFDYVNAMSESWKRQILLNLVKNRYLGAPVFLDVASVINQYSLEGEIALGASWSDAVSGDSQTLGGPGRYADRPTITYAPISGARFAQQLMTPYPGGCHLIPDPIRLSCGFRVAHWRANDNRGWPSGIHRHRADKLTFSENSFL